MIKTPKKGFIAFLARAIYPISRLAYRTFWASFGVYKLHGAIDSLGYNHIITPEFASATQSFFEAYMRSKQLEREYREYDG
jgi:hypothetical protein